MSRNPTTRFDAIVVGAGAGGLTVAFGLARIGKRLALIEADAVGGDCTNVGCIPSKTLLDLSGKLAASSLERGSAAWSAAAAMALAEVRRKRDALRLHETEMLEREPNLTLIRGTARLAGRGRLLVESGGGSRELQAPTIVWAAGASPSLARIPGLPEERILSNHTLFEQAQPPAHLAVLGGGPIGVEMATAFARLGAVVTLIEAQAQLLPRSEPAAGAVVGAALERLGVRVRLGVRAEGYAEEALLLSNGERVAGVTAVLMALGRKPNVGNLPELGVRVDAAGIRTDRHHRTNLRGLYAIGDATNRAKFTHAANAQGRRLVRHLTLPWLPLVREGDYPSATFSDPEVAQIGPTLAELHAGIPAAAITTLRVDLRDLDRGLVTGLEEGFVMLHARRLSGRLLGATVVGPHASEIINLLVWAQRRRVSLWQLSRHVVAYPALSEGIKRAADQFLFASLRRLPRELGVYLRTRFKRSRS